MSGCHMQRRQDVDKCFDMMANCNSYHLSLSECVRSITAFEFTLSPGGRREIGMEVS